MTKEKNKITFDPVSESELTYLLLKLSKESDSEKRNVFKAQACRHIFVYSLISPSLHTLAS